MKEKIVLEKGYLKFKYHPILGLVYYCDYIRTKKRKNLNK